MNRSSSPLFAEVAAGVAALNQAGRWHDALAASVQLYRQFPDEPQAYSGMVEALVGLGRAEEAEVVLRDLGPRFPRDRWIPVRRARLAFARQDWRQALAHWGSAGLPDPGLPDHADADELRLFALAMAQAGEGDGALQLLAAPRSGPPGQGKRLLGALEILMLLGRTQEAAVRWPALAEMLDMTQPDFAAVTGRLAMSAPETDAAPMLTALLAEADPGGPHWIPAIATTLAGLTAADPLHDRVRRALATAAPDVKAGLAFAVAQGLCGAIADADALAGMVARAVASGRPGLLPLLLETAGGPGRKALLRVALRLYLNRVHADPAALAAIDPPAAACLLRIAAVADPDVLRYVAEPLRARFPVPVAGSLARCEDCVGAVVRMAPPGLARRPSSRLRVALCVAGRLAARSAQAPGLIRALRLQAHDTTVFAHVWRDTGTAAPSAELETELRRLPPRLALAFAEAADAGGLAGLRRLYPALLQERAARPTVTEAELRALLQTDQAVVEDEASPALAQRPAAWKALHATRQAHAMAAAFPGGFDLCVHLQADAVMAAAETFDWAPVAQAVHGEALMLVDRGMQFDRAGGFCLAPRLAVGSMATMAIAADSAARADHVATGRQPVWGMARTDALPQALAMQLHLHGIVTGPLDGVAFDVAAEAAPLAAAAALALLWQDIRARRAASPDHALVRAAMGDVTGGMSA